MQSHPHRHLFTPAQIGAWALQHRLVCADALVQSSRLTASDATASTLDFYAQRSTPGGLMVCSLLPSPDTAGTSPVAASLQSAAQVNSWRSVIAAIHARGGVAVARIGDLPAPRHELPDMDGVDAAMEGYRTAAENAGDAGFDGVELLATRGTIPERFLLSMAGPSTSGSALHDGDADFLLGALQTLAAVWSADRIGLCLSLPTDPLGVAPRGLWTSLGGLNLAYAHLACIDDSLQASGIEPGTLRSGPAIAGSSIVSSAWNMHQAQAAISGGLADAVSPVRAFARHADLPARWRTALAQPVNPEAPQETRQLPSGRPYQTPP